jgi:hypothetical protein
MTCKRHWRKASPSGIREMPEFELSPEQVANLLAYLKQFAQAGR